MKDKVRTVMIVGGGRVGYYLSKQLLAVGMKVKLIEKIENAVKSCLICSPRPSSSAATAPIRIC